MDHGTVELSDTFCDRDLTLRLSVFRWNSQRPCPNLATYFIFSLSLSFLLVLFQSALQGCNARLNAVRSHLFGSGWPTVLRSVI